VKCDVAAFTGTSKPQGETKTTSRSAARRSSQSSQGECLPACPRATRPVAARHEGLYPLDVGHAWPGGGPARGRFNSGHPVTERGHQPGAGPGRAQCLGQTPQLTEAITSRGLGGKTGS
jgi:hypothetical protein